VTDVLAAFAAGQRRAGDGWTARCPAHDDHRNSLSIGRGDDGRWLLHCHAGCAIDAILAAANLTQADLFPERPARPRHGAVVAVYPYHDERGGLLYENCRCDPKDFFVRDATGRPSIKGIRRVLYHLPDLQGKKTTFITEGEADTDTLRRHGLTSTTNVGGAGKWCADYTAQLKAAGVKNVIILPDNDAPGKAHGITVARSCADAGLSVKLIPLPDLPPKGDVSDFLTTHTKADLLAIVKDAPLFNSARSVTAAQPLVLTSLADLLAEPNEQIEWVWQDRIPVGGIVLIAGAPKGGKSTLMRALAVAIAQGRPCLSWATTPGAVWYFAFQDKRSEVRKHFRRLGATGDEPIRVFINQAPADLIPQLTALAATERPALIVVDMLAQVLKVADFNDYGAVSRAFEPLQALCRTTAAALAVVHHASAHANRDGLDAVLNSTAISGSVDNVFILKRDGDLRTLSSQQRIGPDVAPIVVTLDPQTGDVAAAGSKRDHDDQVLRQQLLTLLRAAPIPIPEATIKDGLVARAKDVGRVLRYLVGTKAVERSGDGVKGKPFVYRLLENTVPAENAVPETAAKTANFSASSGTAFSAHSGLNFDESADSNSVPALYKENREENFNSHLYVDRNAHDLRSIPASRQPNDPDVPAESNSVPAGSENDETDTLKPAIHPDKHCLDSVPDDTLSTEQLQNAGDARFRRGFK
jgi:hypothetical protein